MISFAILTHAIESHLQKYIINPLIVAFQLLTRLPTPQIKELTPQVLGRSLFFYPLIGLIIGLILSLVNWLFFVATPEVASILILITWVLITGGIHLDGLGDSADAWIGGYGDRQRTLEIMKDPYCGPSAVSVLLLVLIGKYAALQHISQLEEYWVLFIIPVVSRSFIVLLFLTTPYVRQHGLGESLASHLPRRSCILLLITITAAIILAFKLSGIILLCCGLIVFLGLRQWMLQRLGGMTGDTAGAMIEVIEVSLLVSYSIFYLNSL